MANEYYPNHYSASNFVVDDMDKMNKNFEALRTVFSSSSGPAVPVPYQIWADSLNHIIKVRDELNAAWLSMFDVGNNEIIIQDTVRKGSIVQGEDIDPATCTLNTCSGGGGGSGMNLPSEYKGSANYIKSVSGPSGGFADIPSLDGLFYIVDGIQVRGKIFVNTSFSPSVKVRAVIGTENSSESSLFVAQGGAWSPEVLLTTVGTGWQTVKWQVDWGTQSSGTITITANSLSEVVS